MSAAAASAAPTPMERRSVLRTLRSPRALRTELLAGLVVGLALIPEAIAFSVIAGVDPRAGLFASFTMAVTTAIVGGRPAMISAATGAVALVVAPLVAAHGADHLIACVILAGILQVLLALVGVARLMRFVPRQVMVGFVNGLAIIVITSQLPELIGVPWMVYPLVALGLIITFGLPRLSTAVPSPLAAVAVVTAVAVLASIAVPSVGDKGELPRALPTLGLPQIPWSLETLRIILPYALSMAVVGLLESLLTAKLVDDITDTPSSTTRETWGQGAANIVTGLFGGMGGCAVIGQTMMNVKASGARTRISTASAGIFLLVLVVVLGDLVAVIPMAALAAVMIYVGLTSFDWHSISPRTLRTLPRSEIAVMALTTAAITVSHNLAVGVGAGVLAAMVLFARRVAHTVRVHRIPGGPSADPSADARAAGPDDAAVTYIVDGELFFASSNELYTQFDYAQDPPRVVIDMSRSHIWDASTVAALDSIREKYDRHGCRVEFVGLDRVSGDLHDRLSQRPRT